MRRGYRSLVQKDLRAFTALKHAPLQPAGSHHHPTRSVLGDACGLFEERLQEVVRVLPVRSGAGATIAAAFPFACPLFVFLQLLE